MAEMMDTSSMAMSPLSGIISSYLAARNLQMQREQMAQQREQQNWENDFRTRWQKWHEQDEAGGSANGSLYPAAPQNDTPFDSSHFQLNIFPHHFRSLQEMIRQSLGIPSLNGAGQAPTGSFGLSLQPPITSAPAGLPGSPGSGSGQVAPASPAPAAMPPGIAAASQTQASTSPSQSQPSAGLDPKSASRSMLQIPNYDSYSDPAQIRSAIARTTAQHGKIIDYLSQRLDNGVAAAKAAIQRAGQSQSLTGGSYHADLLVNQPWQELAAIKGQIANQRKAINDRLTRLIDQYNRLDQRRHTRTVPRPADMQRYQAFSATGQEQADHLRDMIFDLNGQMNRYDNVIASLRNLLSARQFQRSNGGTRQPQAKRIFRWNNGRLTPIPSNQQYY